jgi:RecA-family ATPase
MRRLGASQHEIETALIALAKESGLPVREAIRTAASISKKASGPEEEVAKLVHSLDIRDEAYRRRRRRDVKFVELPQDTLKDALKRPRDPTAFTVHSLFPTGGNTLFLAQRKAGKTTVSMNLVKCLADREPFLGEFEVEPPKGRIGYLNYELNENQCLEWLHDMDIQHQSRISVLNLRGKPGCLWIDDNMDKFTEWLRSKSISCLVIDPAGRAWRGVVEDENSNSQVREFTSILDEVKLQGGVSDLVLIHHIGKSHREEGTERGRGASALEDWPDAIWVLTKDESGIRSLSAEGRDVELEPHDLDYDRESRLLTISGTRKVRRAEDKAMVTQLKGEVEIDQLLAALKKTGPISKQSLMNYIGWSRRTHDRTIAYALTEGLIVQRHGPKNSLVLELEQA